MKEYFPHDFYSRNSLELQAMMGECGEGSYGIFWAIVEVLHELRNRVPMKQYIFSGVADQIKTTSEKVEKVVSVCIKMSVFVEKNGFFSSSRVRANRTKRLAISKIRANSGKRGAIAKQNLAKERKGKEKKEKERKVNEIKEKENIVNPFGNLECWGGWIEYKKQEHNESYKSVKTEQAAINQLYELSQGDPARARKIIEQSISNQWKGLFPLKNESNGSSQTNLRDRVSAEFKKRFGGNGQAEH